MADPIQVGASLQQFYDGMRESALGNMPPATVSAPPVEEDVDTAIDALPSIEIPDFDFLSPEQLADLQGLSDTVIGQYESYLEPGYSAVSPELMNTLQSQIGGVFQQAMDRNTFGANVGGFSPASGITGQANLYAGSQAANALGALTGAVSSANTQAQQWATQQLENLREFDVSTLAGQLGLGAALQSGMTGMAGPGVLAGPTSDLTDPMSFWNSIWGQDQLGQEMQRALEAGEITATDIMPLLVEMFGYFNQ